MINKHSRNNNYYNINNDYISGFIHADGSLSSPFVRGGKNKNKLYMIPQFNLYQHINNKEIVLLIKEVFNNSGNIIYQTNNIMKYKITNIEHIINIIIPFFDKHQLRSNKYFTFLKFKLLVNILYYEQPIYGSSLWLYCAILATNLNPLIKKSVQLRYLNNKEQDIIINGIIPEDINIKELQSKYCSELLNITDLNDHSSIKNSQPINKDFINGLIDGDGSLYIAINKIKNKYISWQSTIQIIQDINNESLLNEIKLFFNDMGSIRKHKIEKSSSYYITKTDILNIVIPKLTNYEDLNNLNFNELTGPKIKLYKFYNFILINEILKSNKLSDPIILNNILDILYNVIDNKKNITLDEYKTDMINKLKISHS